MEQWITEIIDPYYLRILILMGINIIMVLGLNITTGVTGQLSMGHAGFMSLGGLYLSHTDLRAGHTFLADAAGRCGCGGGFSDLLSDCRLCAWEGDYLAMVTIGFAEIVRVFFLNFEPGGKAVGLFRHTSTDHFQPGSAPDHRGDILYSALVVLAYRQKPCIPYEKTRLPLKPAASIPLI